MAPLATHDVDVAIVGYGPVGATAANLLGQLGVRTLVLERDPDVYNRARAISTDEEILRIWQRIGLADRLKADMLSDRPIDFLGADGRRMLDLAPSTRGNGHPTQLFIYQPALERVLREGVERFDSVTVLLGHECTDLSQDADEVRLSVTRRTDNADLMVRARYVIAADGGSSTIRSRLGIGFDGRTYEDRWIVIDTKVLRPWPEVDRLRFHCNPDRPAVDCPTPLGHHRWEFPVLPTDDEAELVTDAAVSRLLKSQGIAPDSVDILRAVVYSHHVRFASTWRDRRILLVGDAAHVMPPWIGEGMASGVRDAANLCWKVAAVLRAEQPETLLNTYQLERAPHVRELTRLAVTFGRIITERRPLLARVRDPLIRAAMVIAPIGDYVRQGRWFPDTRVSRGLLASRPRNRRDAVGWQIPQPWVLTHDRGRLLLDDALPAGWVVLTLESRASTPTTGTPTVEILPPDAPPRPGAITDVDDVLIPWLVGRNATRVTLRPDHIVYSAAGRRARRRTRTTSRRPIAQSSTQGAPA